MLFYAPGVVLCFKRNGCFQKTKSPAGLGEATESHYLFISLYYVTRELDASKKKMPQESCIKKKNYTRVGWHVFYKQKCHKRVDKISICHKRVDKIWIFLRLPIGKPVRVTRVESAEGGRRILPRERHCHHVLLAEILKKVTVLILISREKHPPQGHCPNSNL